MTLTHRGISVAYRGDERISFCRVAKQYVLGEGQAFVLTHQPSTPLEPPCG